MPAIAKKPILVAIILISLLFMLDYFWRWAGTQYIPTFAVKLVEQHIADEIAEIKKVNTENALGYGERLKSCQKPDFFVPYQTNGNRLRRWFNRKPLDDDNIGVNYADCSILFKIRRQTNGEWKVIEDHSHAG